MKILNLQVYNQKLNMEESEKTVAGVLNYIKCVFDFKTEDWTGTVKTAYFKNPKTGAVYSQMLDEAGGCFAPHEALADSGYISLSVIGEKDDYRITSSEAMFYNGGTILNGEPSDPTPSQYEQIISIVSETLDSSQKANAAAGKAESAAKNAQYFAENADNAVKNLNISLEQKVDICQGTEDAGKFLGIDNNGNVSPRDTGLDNIKTEINDLNEKNETLKADMHWSKIADYTAEENLIESTIKLNFDSCAEIILYYALTKDGAGGNKIDFYAVNDLGKYLIASSLVPSVSNFTKGYSRVQKAGTSYFADKLSGGCDNSNFFNYSDLGTATTASYMFAGNSISGIEIQCDSNNALKEGSKFEVWGRKL